MSTNRRAQGPRWLHGLALAGLAVVKVVTAVCAAEGALHPTAKRYRGKAMRIRAVGYFGGLSLVPAVWAVQRAQRPYPAGADLAVSVPLLIDAAGNTLGVYDDARLDDLVHGVNAASLASLFGAVISPHVRSRQQATLATIAFGVIGELGWEAMEYTGEALGFKGMKLSENDTIGDVVAAFMGTGLAAAITWVRWRPSPGHPLADWGEPSPATVAASEVQPPDLSAPLGGGPESAVSPAEPARQRPGRPRTAGAPVQGEARPRSRLPAPPRASGGPSRSPRRDS
ncbi:MAG: hypothetical protein QOH61_229 [Chloroflexota bacterium]|jgi:hypothetical protein|nr:hypothetical protein [Chloroflexota bacterium]